MVKLIKSNIDQIQELCRQHHVRSLYLFGSAYDGSFSEESDVDFLYEINHQLFKENQQLDYADNLFDLEQKLETVLNRKVDLIRVDFNQAIPFIKAVGNNKQLIYAAGENKIVPGSNTGCYH